MHHRCLIAFGANTGSPREIWSRLPELLAPAGILIRNQSPLWETRPVGGPGGQADYLNGAISAQTELSPAATVEALLGIERQLGRVRTVRHGPRAVDLDLLLFDDVVVDEAGVVLPHPRMAWRRFVLEPVAGIEPDWVHPVTGLTVSRLLQRIDELPRWVTWLAPGGSVLREEAPHFCPWKIWIDDDTDALADRAIQSPLFVWDSREWTGRPDARRWISAHRGAVMDLAREPGSGWEAIETAIRAMEG